MEREGNPPISTFDEDVLGVSTTVMEEAQTGQMKDEFPQQSLLAAPHGAMSTVAHHSGSSILQCSCPQLRCPGPAAGLSPHGPVLLILMPLLPGATARPWAWAALLSLSMPPEGSSQQGPVQTSWWQLG